jgi:glycosyltransferase involved in cell wall biosynthesis
MSDPAVSVITVCRNAREALLKTRDSINEQTCRDFEWIIVDGDSTDGTVQLLQSMKGARWISEPDGGIYEAMNKGLKMARGHRVWFMNAGDRLASADSLETVVSAPGDADICYGEALVEDRQGRILGPRSVVTPHKLPEKVEKDVFSLGMVVSHQAFLPRRAIAPMYQADRYRFSADLDWILTILSRPRICLNLGPLARVEREGASLDFWKRSQAERFLILSRHFGYIRTIGNHLQILFRRLRHGLRTSYWK